MGTKGFDLFSVFLWVWTSTCKYLYLLFLRQSGLFLLGRELLWTLVDIFLEYEENGSLACAVVFHVGICLKFLWLSISSPHLEKQNAFSSELKRLWLEQASPGSHQHIHTRSLSPCFPRQLYIITQAASKRQACNIR